MSGWSGVLGRGGGGRGRGEWVEWEVGGEG